MGQNSGIKMIDPKFFLVMTVLAATLFWLVIALSSNLNLLAVLLIVLLSLIIFTGIIYLLWERKRARCKEKEYELFIENLPITVLFIKKNKIHYINNRGLYLFEAESKDDITGNSLYDFTSIDKNMFLAEEKSDLNESEGGTIIGKLRTCQGQMKDVKINYFYNSFLQQEGYSVVIKDITEFKENEKKLHHSEQLSVIGELAAGVAHEIRNPLTSIMGFLQLIDNDGHSTKMYKEIMASELDRINLIVNELLLLAKPKEYEYVPRNLLSLINTVVTIANTQAILHNIQIVTKFSDDIRHLLVNCEENKLKQVFLNLLKNAIEAMSKEGQITIEIRKKSDQYVIISFIDQGDGIPEEMLHNLGKRFYTTKDDGTGLGLMISMNIIREHKGELNITSKKGVGTKIDVSLPI
ncbi:signal transduction histidine kinase [Evansella vedderi]|uniref:histidine kinase n=1 Tax=Evansella vedderi TaxID=38282 RepID=A0ABU0A0D3_9BACI|nr:ATP-binding protein [Evansella vedderi]MDQ0256951.1 signal transduction histidine kinase [Evansella vedderi]